MRIRLLSFPDPILNNNNNILSGSYRVAYHRQCLSALCNKDQHHDKVVANTDQFSTVNPTSVQRVDISLILCDTFGPLSSTTNYEVTHYTAQLGRWGGSPVWTKRACIPLEVRSVAQTGPCSAPHRARSWLYSSPWTLRSPLLLSFRLSLILRCPVPPTRQQQGQRESW
jgi:hypothetical protein